MSKQEYTGVVEMEAPDDAGRGETAAGADDAGASVVRF